MTRSHLPLSPLTLDAIQATALRRHLNKDRLVDPSLTTPWWKLAILLSAVAQVGDLQLAPRGKDAMVAALLDVAAIAASWVESLEGASDSS